MCGPGTQLLTDECPFMRVPAFADGSTRFIDHAGLLRFGAEDLTGINTAFLSAKAGKVALALAQITVVRLTTKLIFPVGYHESASPLLLPSTTDFIFSIRISPTTALPVSLQVHLKGSRCGDLKGVVHPA